jgi:hypothetical protein
MAHSSKEQSSSDVVQISASSINHHLQHTHR